MKAHRLGPESSGDAVASVGADDSNLATGVNHVINHPVAQHHPLPETKVGPYIKDVGDGPSVWHGVQPTVTREQVEDEWNRRQKEATMVAGSADAPTYYPDPVPVMVVAPRTGKNSLKSFNTFSSLIPIDQAALIVPRNYATSRVLLRNEDSTNPIRIGRTAATAAQGFLLAATREVELYVQEAIYALAFTANVHVSVLIELGIDE